jgi:hypothetical protein
MTRVRPTTKPLSRWRLPSQRVRCALVLWLGAMAAGNSVAPLCVDWICLARGEATDTGEATSSDLVVTTAQAQRRGVRRAPAATHTRAATSHPTDAQHRPRAHALVVEPPHLKVPPLRC